MSAGRDLIVAVAGGVATAIIIGAGTQIPNFGTWLIGSLGAVTTESLPDQIEAAVLDNESLKNELRGEPGLPGLAQFPEGAVVAFHARLDDDDDHACPTGWIPYEAAAGRMIVGAGPHDDEELSVYPGPIDNTATHHFTSIVEDRIKDPTGGEEQVTLTLDQLPPHQHRAEVGTLAGEGVFGQGNAISNAIFGTSRGIALETLVSPEGGGTAHNNLPPYIALYWCTPAGRGDE